MNRLRCHLALVYRLSLRDGWRGSTLEFSSQAQFTASHSTKGKDGWIGRGGGGGRNRVVMLQGVEQAKQTLQLNLKLSFVKSRLLRGLHRERERERGARNIYN